MKPNVLLLPAIAAVSIALSIHSLAQERTVPAVTARTASLPVEGKFPSLGGATEWLNSEPLTREMLRGKVVVVDFWT